MKLRGVRMDETHAVMLLRICYNRLRQGWVPGGYPPHRLQRGGGGGGLGASSLSPLRQRLLEALTPRGRAVELREQPDVAWVAQAFGVYREAVTAGVKPSMRMLNRMLMCLRVAWEGKQVGRGASSCRGAICDSGLWRRHQGGMLAACAACAALHRARFEPATGVRSRPAV
jgi:hypothetical protein